MRSPRLAKPWRCGDPAKRARFCHRQLMLSVTLGVLGSLLWLVGSVGSAVGDEAPETYQQILAKREVPKIDDLSERASPERTGEAVMESFHDLLKLREQPVPEAVPELIEILAAHQGSTRIHRFAAAQALFAVGTDDARQALEKYLLQPDYPATQAIGFTSHWEMSEPQRSRFIEQYLLRDLSKDLAVTVHPRWIEDRGEGNREGAAERKLLVTVKLLNQAKQDLTLAVHPQYQAKALYFRGPSGAFVPRAELVVYNPQRPRWERLGPGESTSFDVKLQLQTDRKRPPMFRGQAEPFKALLSSGDVGFALSEFGEYKLYGMMTQTPLADEQLQWLQASEGIAAKDVWMGRAVSEPVEVELRPTGESTK